MLFTMSLRVASVMIGDSGSSGGVRAPAPFSIPAISAVTTPCRTALSIALNAPSAWRWMSTSSRMCSCGAVAPDIQDAVAMPSAPAHTFASKNQNER